MEGRIESERLYVKIDENGKIVESSYLPMVDAHIEPIPTPLISAGPPERASFQIDEKGIIFDASPRKLNGRKVVLHGPSSPALGRTDTVTPKCTWAPDGKGGWTCI